MKKGLNRKQKNYLIGGLLAVALVMAVGYAAFSTSLNITNTAKIDSKWDVRITNIVADKTAEGTSPNYTTTGDITHSIEADGLTANFEAALVSPGESVEYTVTVTNAGTLDAVINGLTLNNGSNNAIEVTTNPATLSNSSALFVAKNGGTTTLKVTVKYKDTVSGQPATADKTLGFSVTLNAVQNDGSYTEYVPAPASFTGTIYRNNSTKASIGDSIVPVSETKWCAIDNSGSSCDFGRTFETESECNAFVSYNNTEETCEQRTLTLGGVGEYTTDPSTLGESYYLKHTVVDNIITESYACTTFGIAAYQSNPQCVRGGTENRERPSNFYGYSATPAEATGNYAILSALKGQNGISCTLGEYSSYCGVGGFKLDVNYEGSVYASYNSSGSVTCYITEGGRAYCS